MVTIVLPYSGWTPNVHTGVRAQRGLPEQTLRSTSDAFFAC